MAVPWIQIVQLMPTILDVSKELLKRAKRAPPAPPAPPLPADSPAAPLQARIVALEENERKQAELISNMADQLARNRLKQCIAGAMPVAVVDRFEAVEIDKHQGGLRSIALHV